MFLTNVIVFLFLVTEMLVNVLNLKGDDDDMDLEDEEEGGNNNCVGGIVLISDISVLFALTCKQMFMKIF